MRQVVCLADQPWSALPTRTQQLITRINNAQVLYLEPAPLKGAWKKPGRKLRPDLISFTLPPMHLQSPAGRLLARYDASRVLRFVRDLLEKYRFESPLLWCATPVGTAFLDEFPYRGLVYDCAQDWPDYPESWESDLTSAADVCFAASPDLMRHLAPCNGNVTLLPYGCNYPMFAKDHLPIPQPLRSVDRPILGYVGSLWPDLDLTPILQLAQARPDCVIVLIGPDRGCYLLPALLEQPNVRYLGAVAPVDLPDYLSAFRVCLQVLRRGRLYDDVIPSRMFEYLSSGKPIVSMLRPDQVEHFPDVVYGAHTPAEFVSLCSRALEETGTYARDRRREYGKAAAWSNRADEVNRILESIGLF